MHFRWRLGLKDGDKCMVGQPRPSEQDGSGRRVSHVWLFHDPRKEELPPAGSAYRRLWVHVQGQKSNWFTRCSHVQIDDSCIPRHLLDRRAKQQLCMMTIADRLARIDFSLAEPEAAQGIDGAEEELNFDADVMKSLSLDDGPNDDDAPVSAADDSAVKVVQLPTSDPSSLAQERGPLASVDANTANDDEESGSLSEESEENETGDGGAIIAEKSAPSAPPEDMEYPDTSIDVSYDRSSSMRIHPQTSQDSVTRQASDAAGQDTATQQKSKGVASLKIIVTSALITITQGIFPQSSANS